MSLLMNDSGFLIGPRLLFSSSFLFSCLLCFYVSFLVLMVFCKHHLFACATGMKMIDLKEGYFVSFRNVLKMCVVKERE